MFFCILKIVLCLISIGIIIRIAYWCLGGDTYEDYNLDPKKDWMREHEKTLQPEEKE